MHDQSNEPFANVTDNLDERKPATLPDLPPVEPPSAGFVVQLFVIPAVVVVVVIIVWLLFGKLAGGERDAMEYVRQLRSPTANWRLAFELASLIQHDPKIGSDPVLLGELSDLLSHELDRNEEDLRLTQYVALDAGRVPDAGGQDAERPNHRPPRAAGTARLLPSIRPRFGSRLPPAWPSRRHGWTARSKIQAPSKPWARRRRSANPRCARWPFTLSVFLEDRRRRKFCASACQETKTALSATMPPSPSPGAAIPPARATLREMLSTADLNKVIDLPGTTEKQNKIEAIELEAIDALRNSITKGKTELAESLRPQITDLTKSGLVSVRSQSQEILQNLQRH